MGGSESSAGGHVARRATSVQQLAFSAWKKKDKETEEDRAEQVQERKAVRSEPQNKYRYRPQNPEDYRRWQGHWEHDAHGRRYWKTDYTHKPPNRHRLTPREGGRWPLRDRNGVNRQGGIFPVQDRSERDAWIKYRPTPQRFPHKSLSDLGDNWISGFATSKYGAGDPSPFEDRFVSRPYPFSSSRAPRIFRGLSYGGRSGRDRVRRPPRGRWRYDGRGRRYWERGHYKRKPGRWRHTKLGRVWMPGAYVRKNGKRVWVPSTRNPRGRLPRRYADPGVQGVDPRNRVHRQRNPSKSARRWPYSRNARRGVWVWDPKTRKRRYEPYERSPYNPNGSRDLRSPYWNRHHRRQRLKPVMQKLNRGKLPRDFLKSRYVPR